jgi:DinB superfamily
MTAPTAPRDPGAESLALGRAYQQTLLAALGEDDPAVAQAETPANLRRLIADAGSNLRTRPEPAEWSVIELVGHIVDAELSSSARYRWILAEDEPELVPYDQDLWASRFHSVDEPVDDLLPLFDALRVANLRLWQASSAEDRARLGHHLERGPESYELTFRLLAGHDRVHIAQARAGLDRIRSRAG